MESITEKIDRFYESIDDTHTRYRSWEWCHKAFLGGKEEYWNTDNKTAQDRIVDYLALHLAFYLASWGMYRGSSFLLQRDYRAHIPAVKCILGEQRDQYDLLWDYKPNKKNINEATVLLFGENDIDKKGLYYEIGKKYGLADNDAERVLNNEIKETDGLADKNNGKNNDTPTDTLITKILMGTFGCVPAFDRFLKSGIATFTAAYAPNKNCVNKIKSIDPQTCDKQDHNECENCYRKHTNGFRLTQSINRNTFQALAHLAINNSKSFTNAKAKGVFYPPMKCIDMYFWEIGYEIDIANGLSTDKNNALLKQAKELGLCSKDISDSIKAAGEIRAKNGKQEDSELISI